MVTAGGRLSISLQPCGDFSLFRLMQIVWYSFRIDPSSAGAVGDAAGAGTGVSTVVANGDTVDGQLTSDAATAGAQASTLEEITLEGAGSAVP